MTQWIYTHPTTRETVRSDHPPTHADPAGTAAHREKLRRARTRWRQKRDARRDAETAITTETLNATTHE